MSTFMLEALSRPNFFMRHQNFEGELNEFEKEHGMDYQFEIVPTNAGNEVRLKATNPFSDHREFFIRHQNFRVLLQPPPDGDPKEQEQFRLDSTFFMVGGLANPVDGVSFQSVIPNLADFYIRHRDFHIFLEAKNQPNAPADSTFFKRAPR